MQMLLKAETAERQVRSINYQMAAARFPAHRDLAGFDFEQASVDVTLVRELHTVRFCESAQNVVFIGGPGTGKTPPCDVHRYRRNTEPCKAGAVLYDR